MTTEEYYIEIIKQNIPTHPGIYHEDMNSWFSWNLEDHIDKYHTKDNPIVFAMISSKAHQDPIPEVDLMLWKQTKPLGTISIDMSTYVEQARTYEKLIRI